MDKNEEWNNFMHRINEVSTLVRDMASGDKTRSDAAKSLADKYLAEKDLVIREEDIVMKVKSNRTVINRNAVKDTENAGEVDKETWMREMEKDADKRALDKKIRRERADTLKTQAEKAFRREDFDRALSCYNRAIEQIRDNPMLYCDRALTNIKLGNYQKVFRDTEMALRINENSFKARLYTAKAYLELEESDKYDECRKELEEKFPQHQELIDFYLKKKEDDDYDV